MRIRLGPWGAIILVLLLAGACSQAAPNTAVAPAAPPAQTSGSSAPRVSESKSADTATTGGAASEAWDRYVIRQATMTLIVKDVEATASEVEKVAAQAGGYVSQSNTRRDAGRILADLTIQVPAEALDSTLSALRQLAVIVETANITSQDVTEEFVDNEARLTNLKAAEASTLRLLDRATKMEDVLTVERELTRLRGEVEKIEGRQRYLQRRVAMSSITVRLQPETAAAVASARAGWQPWQNVLAAWEASLNFLSQALTGLMVAVAFLWWTVPLVVGVVWWRRRHPPKPRQRPPFPPQPTTPPPAA